MIKQSDEVSQKSPGLYARLVWLAIVILLSGVVAALIGRLVFDSSIGVILLALATCLVATLVAHVAGEYPQGDLYFTARLALQMAVRTGLPLVVAVWGLYFAEPPLETSLVFYMILFYLIGLVADVQLTLTRLNSESPAAKHLRV